MKKSFLFTTLIAFATLAGSFNAQSFDGALAYSNIGKDSWTVASGALTIDTLENGVQINGPSAFGARAYYSYPVDLSDFSFDYEVLNPTNFQQFGFYFSSVPGLFYSEIANSESISLFTTVVGIGSETTQTSLFIRRNHDYYNGNELNYREPNLESGTGFHAASRLVMNTIPGKMGLSFSFENYDEQFLKLTIKEKYQQQIWEDNFNYSKDGEYATVTTYLRKDYLSLIEGGNETYIHFYTLDGTTGHKTQFTNLEDKNMKDAAAFAQSFVDELTCDPTGTTAPSKDQWNALKTKYDALTPTAKKYFEVGYNGDDIIKEAMNKYDYIVSKYQNEYENFINREVVGLSNTNNIITSNFGNLAIVLITSILSISAIAILFKKKRA